ncbi:zinc finger protein 391-like [Lineus longissimus]|uniref:zinc finger protein 391-like n=1 Tax=Lineus longissimus TaxID=88925 RepID=UPI00315DF60A
MLQVHPVKGDLTKNYVGTKSGDWHLESCVVEGGPSKNMEESVESSPVKSLSGSSQTENVEDNSESSQCKDLVDNSSNESSPSIKIVVRKSPKTLSSEFICEECSETFPRKCLLSRHVKAAHFVEKPHRCGYCGKRYTCKEELKTHHVMHNMESPHRCEQCDARFPKKSQLVRHVRSHTGERPYVCDIDECDKSFTDAHLLTLHKRRHGKLSPFICERCGATFRNNSDIKRHMMSHTDERRHHCDACGKCFRRLEHLKLHLRIHSGEKPHTCDTCSRGFAQLSDLRKHERTHTGERPYTCDCGKAFASKAAYQRHDEFHKRDLVKQESDSAQVLEVPQGDVTTLKMQITSPLKLQTEEETLEMLETDKVENLIIDESEIHDISVSTDTNSNTPDLHLVQNILSTLARGDLPNQPLTVIPSDTSSGSQVAVRIVDNNIQVVPLSEIKSEEAGTSSIMQLETGSGFSHTNIQAGDYDHLLLQLQDAVTTASNSAGDQVVQVLLEQGDQVEQEASHIK